VRVDLLNAARRAILYVIVQSLGAMAGAGILKLLTVDGANDSLCTPAPGTDVTLAQTFGYEFLISFVLVFTVFATRDPVRTVISGSGPLSIGLSVAMCHLWAVSNSRTFLVVG